MVKTKKITHIIQIPLIVSNAANEIYFILNKEKTINIMFDKS